MQTSVYLISKSLILITLTVLISLTTKAQLPFKPYNTVEVMVNGAPLKNPWAGGFNSPQFSNIDLNADGVKDLVAFERGFFGVFKGYIQNGINGETNLQYDESSIHLFPHLQNWALLVDYNCDGYEDIFTGVPGGIKVYRNAHKIYGHNHFELVTGLLQTVGLDGVTPLFVSPPDLPAICDVDGDGDMDILTFEQLGNSVEYHKNLSIEKYGNCDSLVFELRNACWGYFSENPIDNSITLYDTCENNVIDPEKTARHAGSTLLGIDVNGDDVKDLVLGDISYNNLSLLENGGTVNNSIIVETDDAFPPGPDAVNITVFPAAYYVDINNNNISDLLVTPNNPNTSENIDNIWCYENLGSENNPDFSFKQNDFLQESMIDLGAGTFPVFFDENSDGLMDIIAGNYGYFEDAGDYRSQLALFRNTGSQSLPSYELISHDYGNFSVLGFNGMYPAFGDMDGDSDLDMLIGDEDGLLHYFVNDAGQGNPANFVLNQPNFKNIDVGQSAKPQLIDVDRDGLIDILTGERSGTLNFYKNTGTGTAPDFLSNPTIENFGAVDVMPECCTGFSAPFLSTDSIGQFILYVGSEQGYLYLYNDIENNLNGTFSIVDSLYLNATHINVDGTDLNGNGKQELVYGQYTGGLAILEYGQQEWIGINEKQKQNLQFELFPNPASDRVNIRFEKKFSSIEFQLTVYNSMGDIVKKEEIQSLDSSLNCSVLPPGLYLITIKYGVYSGSKKLLIN